MSSYVDDEYDVYNENLVCARVEHKCAACKVKILRGFKYYRIGIVFDGGAETIKRCLICQATHLHLRRLGGYQVWPDEKLDCELRYEDEWGELPDKIASLAFETQENMQKRFFEEKW